MIAKSKITPSQRAKVMQDVEICTDEIVFDDVQENLFVLADESSGSIALCSHEVYKSSPEQPRKFLVKFQPRVLLVTGEQSGALVSHCFVRSPAPNMLSTSSMLLCTLHSDNVVRLWNVNDGRCVSNSARNLMASRGVRIKTIKGYPGHVLVFGDQADFYVVNVYTMQVVNHQCLNYKAFAKCKYDSQSCRLQILDEHGALLVLSDSKSKQNSDYRVDEYTTKGLPRKLEQSKMLSVTKRPTPLSFKFEQQFAIDGRSMLNVRRLKECKVLAYRIFQAQSKILMIS
jgi:hypothetical protein